MEYQVGAMLEGAQQIGRGKGRVEHQRQLVFVRQGGNRGDVQHVEAGIAQRFAEQHFRIRANGGAPGIHVARVDERRLDTEAF